ncbi:hypothetical protein BN1708_019112, partial [Verticillium longisporum]
LSPGQHRERLRGRPRLSHRGLPRRETALVHLRPVLRRLRRPDLSFPLPPGSPRGLPDRWPRPPRQDPLPSL